MSSDVVSSLVQWLNSNPEYSWLITFLISAGESVAVIGTIVPGSITMTAIGALIGAGIIPFWSNLFWAFLGAIIGDGISYGLGYYYKDRIEKMWPFKQNTQLLEKGGRFFTKHGSKSVFVGRFVGPIRALIPVVAGMMGMRPLQFLLANVTSAALWAPIYMLPGILLGVASLELPPDIATRVILVLILWTLFILLCLWLIRKIPIVIHGYIMQGFTRFWGAIRRSPQGDLTQTLLRHHNPSKIPLQLTLVFYFLIISAVLTYLCSYIYTYGSPHIFINQSLYHLFRGIYSESGKNLMIYVTLLGQKQVLLPVTTIIIAWLFLTRQWYLASHALALLALTGLSVLLIKTGVHSLRPWGIAHSPESFSFPSGHTTLTTTFYVGMGLLLSHAFAKKWYTLLYPLLGLIILSVSVSRLYLGAHWFTDVVGGWLLGAALLTFIAVTYNRKRIVLYPGKLLMISFLFLVLTYAGVVFKYMPELQANYTQLEIPIQKSSFASWKTQDKNFIPTWHVSLFGFPSQPINLEWIGKLSNIEKTLLKNNWEAPPQRNWLDVLFRLTGIDSASTLPLISPDYLDKKPTLILTKSTSDKKILVLRLWESNVVIEGRKQPLWVGVVGRIPLTYGWLSRRSKLDITITPELVFKTPPTKKSLKLIEIHDFQQGRKIITHKILLID